MAAEIICEWGTIKRHHATGLSCLALSLTIFSAYNISQHLELPYDPVTASTASTASTAFRPLVVCSYNPPTIPLRYCRPPPRAFHTASP